VPVAHKIREQGRLQEEQRRQNEYLAALHETALGLITRRNLGELLQALLDRAATLLDTPHGFIYLLDPDASYMELRVAAGTYRQKLGDKVSPGEGLAGRVWRTGRSLVLEGKADAPGPASGAASPGATSRIGVPLLSVQEVVGVLGLDSEKRVGVVGFDEIAVLSQFARLASVAVDNARLYDAVRRELAERRRVEASLRDSEARYRGLVERSLQGIWEIDGEGVTTFANTRLAQILGYEDAGLLLGRRFYEFFASASAGPALGLLDMPRRAGGGA